MKGVHCLPIANGVHDSGLTILLGHSRSISDRTIGVMRLARTFAQCVTVTFHAHHSVVIHVAIIAYVRRVNFDVSNLPSCEFTWNMIIKVLLLLLTAS